LGDRPQRLCRARLRVKASVRVRVRSGRPQRLYWPGVFSDLRISPGRKQSSSWRGVKVRVRVRVRVRGEG